MTEQDRCLHCKHHKRLLIAVSASAQFASKLMTINISSIERNKQTILLCSNYRSYLTKYYDEMNPFERIYTINEINLMGLYIAFIIQILDGIRFNLYNHNNAKHR